MMAIAKARAVGDVGVMTGSLVEIIFVGPFIEPDIGFLSGVHQAFQDRGTNLFRLLITWGAAPLKIGSASIKFMKIWDMGS